MYAAQAVSAALLRRCRTGEGADHRRRRCSTPRSNGWVTPLYTQMHTGAQPPRMGLESQPLSPPTTRIRRATAKSSSACRTTGAGARWSPMSSACRNWPTTTAGTRAIHAMRGTHDLVVLPARPVTVLPGTVFIGQDAVITGESVYFFLEKQ